MKNNAKWKPRFLSLSLSLMMCFSVLPEEGFGVLTVYAAEENVQNSGSEESINNEFFGIYIDETGNMNPWEDSENDTSGNDNNRYYKIVVSDGLTFFQDVTPAENEPVPEDYNYYYNKDNQTLTLNNLNMELDNQVIINSQYNGLIIELKGDSTLKVKKDVAIFLNGNTTVTGNGSLTAETERGRVIWVDGTEETPGHYEDASEENEESFFLSAIEIGENCKRFVNREHATIHAKAIGEPAISAWNLAYGNTTVTTENGNQIELGRLVNYGTITGVVGLNDGIFDGLVSIATTYEAPNDHAYIGKAYYFTDTEFYPNNMAAQLANGDWRTVGKYDENGNPRPSKVFYQYIYKDCLGSVYTEDRVNPIKFLVYEEDAIALGKDSIEGMLTPDDVAAIDDGLEHVFNSDLYAVWFTNGTATVNGNVMLDVACSSAPQEEWKEDEDNVCYVKDSEGNVLFQDSSESSITINGSTGFLSLSDSYQGSVVVRDDINFCATYAERDFLKQWIYRLQWQYDGSPHHPEETYYCAVPKAGKVVENGQFTDKVKELALAENVKLAGQGLYEGTYFSQTETQMSTGINEEKENVAGTSAVINDSTLLVNVSKKNGLEENAYPLVRKASEAARTIIQSKLSNTVDMIAMDIAIIQKQYEIVENEKKLTSQKEVEPTGAVNLYFDKMDLSKFTKPALYHIKDDGTIEKITITQDADNKHIQCQTTSFSTYVFAEDQEIEKIPSEETPSEETPSGGTTPETTEPEGTPSGGTAPETTEPEGTPSGGTAPETTEPEGTPSGGTADIPSTEIKQDGNKAETSTEIKPDGSKVETKVETTEDGSVKTTKTVTKADGSVTRTEKNCQKNTKGKEVAVTTTTEMNATGKIIAVTEKSVIASSSATTSTTVIVKKKANGTIVDADANITKTVGKGNKATVSAAIVSQIVEAAGTKDVQVSMKVQDNNGKTKYKVEVAACDLKAGKDLFIYQKNTKTGEYTMVNAKAYKVSKDGSVAVSMSKKATYELVSGQTSGKIAKQIKATIKPQKSSASVKKGKTTSFILSKKVNDENIKSITYVTSKKSIATVSKSGKITAKAAGAVTINANVTLKNGDTKTVKMKINVQ